MVNVEQLARDLHEAGREAEWDEISEDAREGRRIQARWLLEHYTMILK